MNLEDVKVHLNTHADEAILVVGVLKFEVKYTRAIWGPMSFMLWRKLVILLDHDWFQLDWQCVGIAYGGVRGRISNPIRAFTGDDYAAKRSS